MTGKHEKQQHVMKTHSNDQSTPDASQLPGSGGPLPQQIHEQNPRSMEDAASSDSSAGRGAPPATSDTLGRVCTVLDPNHLINNGPLFPSLERDKRIRERTAKFTKAAKSVRTDLEERKNAER